MISRKKKPNIYFKKVQNTAARTLTRVMAIRVYCVLVDTVTVRMFRGQFKIKRDLKTLR